MRRHAGKQYRRRQVSQVEYFAFRETKRLDVRSGALKHVRRENTPRYRVIVDTFEDGKLIATAHHARPEHQDLYVIYEGKS